MVLHQLVMLVVVLVLMQIVFQKALQYLLVVEIHIKPQ